MKACDLVVAVVVVLAAAAAAAAAAVVVVVVVVVAVAAVVSTLTTNIPITSHCMDGATVTRPFHHHRQHYYYCHFYYYYLSWNKLMVRVLMLFHEMVTERIDSVLDNATDR